MPYRVKTGMNLSSGRRVEPGTLLADDEVAKRSVGWLTRRGHLVHEPDPDEPQPAGEEA